MTENTAPPKAMPTRYAGYHFRSRLEARWAVFFDSLKVKWEYEPQGYELPSGNYLPDFKVFDFPGIGSEWEWFEVKGTIPTVSETQLLKELCAQTGAWGTFLGSVPAPEDVRRASTRFHVECLTCQCATRLTGTYFPLAYGVPMCPRCMSDCAQNRHVMVEPPIYADRSAQYTKVGPKVLMHALAAARSARFEHGHSGAS